MPDSLNAVLILALIVAPGYLTLNILRPRIKLYAPLSEVEFVVATVAAGVVVQALAYPFLGWEVVRDWEDKHINDTWAALAWVAITLLVLPLILGLVVASLVNSENRFIKWIARSDQARIPRAWVFSLSRSQGCFVRIWLNDEKGSVIGGVYGKSSHASTDHAYQDLYLQQVWELDKQTHKFIRPVPSSAGMWLSPESIQRIEFGR